MPDNTYKVVELVGSSHESVDDAIKGAVTRAAKTLRNLDWFEVREIRGQVADGEVAWFQVKMGVGFKVLEPSDMGNE